MLPIAIEPSYVIALLLVAFHASNRFNTPRIVRSQTSRVQFWLSGGAYVVSSIGVFMLLSWAVRHNASLVGVLQMGSATQGGADVSNLDAALVAALMLTMLLPSFPVLRDIDAGILRFFYRMGSIPFCAQLWARQMESVFSFPPDATTSMHDFILNAAHLPDALRLNCARIPSRIRCAFASHATSQSMRRSATLGAERASPMTIRKTSPRSRKTWRLTSPKALGFWR